MADAFLENLFSLKGRTAVVVGGTGVLVPSAHTAAEDVARARREHLVAPTLGDAVRWFLSGRRDPDGIHPVAPTRRHP